MVLWLHHMGFGIDLFFGGRSWFPPRKAKIEIGIRKFHDISQDFLCKGKAPLFPFVGMQEEMAFRCHKEIRVHLVHVRKTIPEPEPASADFKLATYQLFGRCIVFDDFLRFWEVSALWIIHLQTL